jgi:hypothetical protein
MATWNNGHQQEEDDKALELYERKDLTNSRQFTRELHAINSNQTLTTLDKYKYKKQLMRTVFIAKQQEINHHLESFENYLLARKDVEAKSITLEAQKAIMVLEKQQLEMMKAMGLSHSDEISETLISSGNMLTGKLKKVEESDMAPEIKVSTIKQIRQVWEKTNNRIMESVDTYMDELYEKERG